MNLPEGIKHAVHMGANEAILEWTCDPTEENLGHLGASYQEIGATGDTSDLAAWDDGGADFETLMCRAGIEFARGMIAEAANIGTVPARVQPYMPELAPLVAVLRQALATGDVDEEAIGKAIWG